ncbi:DUF6093 family protein [Kitasatospora sp. NPDC059795]|uniref:DUF6093 family protein n=1 Tax=Kitasatospora sp. NPDC059795 TaxID=3346949 RepID=UPI00365B0F03
MTTPPLTPGTAVPDPGGVIAAVERMLLSDETVRISVPGTPVFDPDTGQYVPGPPEVLYEGPGAHRASGGPGLVLRLDGQPYKDDGDGRYRLFTPLSAPVAPEAAEVTIVSSVDGAAAGRVFTVLDPGETGTHSVVRVTWMRITKAGAAA